jgi:hypothetical protein
VVEVFKDVLHPLEAQRLRVSLLSFIPPVRRLIPVSFFSVLGHIACVAAVAGVAHHLGAERVRSQDRWQGCTPPPPLPSPLITHHACIGAASLAFFIQLMSPGIAMPMQQLLVRPRSLAAVDDIREAQPCADAAIDFMGESTSSSSSDSNVKLPCGDGVLAGRVWTFGGKDVMVAAAVGQGGWGGDAASEAAVRVVRLHELEALALSVCSK